MRLSEGSFMLDKERQAVLTGDLKKDMEYLNGVLAVDKNFYLI